MNTIKTVFKTGFGPSSSHTMGPALAAERFLEKTHAATYEVTLYGSLAATGKGHLTDESLRRVLGEDTTKIFWRADIVLPEHPNALKLEAYDAEHRRTLSETWFSVGGGEITQTPGAGSSESLYELHTMSEILSWCQKQGKNLWEYVAGRESPDIWDYLESAWRVMQEAVRNGLDHESRLPGPLNVARKASSYFTKAQLQNDQVKQRTQLYAYALAVAEENASGGRIVTAPTCGSCGVLPAVLYLLQDYYKFNKKRVLHALATAGLIGNLIRHNASISGAEVGCQGEIGTACAMSAAAAAQLFGGTPAQVEYAAEMGLEHHLGLTCDPIMGLVQIPCIERNAFAAARAMDAKDYALLSDGVHRVSFDQVVEAMKETGHDMPNLYRETSLGGLAKAPRNCSEPPGP